MEIIIAVTAKIAEYTVAPVGRQLGYLFHYTTNVQNLRKELQDLKNVEDRMKHDVSNAKNNCEEIYADVESWLSSVDEVSLEANTFLNLDDHAKVVCSCGSFPHLVMRHQLSRQAKKMSIRVLEARERRNFENISYCPPIESSFQITKGYETFDSRKETLKDIMVAVKDAKRSRIGLYGMPGIGKTMLVKEIARQADEEKVLAGFGKTMVDKEISSQAHKEKALDGIGKTMLARQAQEEKLFSKVVMTTVSRTPNVKEIQQYIADKLELKFDQTDSMGKRADLLRTRLKQDDNKILLILDDVWNELDLEVIGIHDECKMLLTSRSRYVLSSYMGIAMNDIFKIEALSPEEAIHLFKKIIGDIVENSDYKDLAPKIVGECAGLPISIATIAHALKSMELHAWKDALKQLQTSSFTGIEGMNEKVYSSIRLSYDFLGSHKEAKLLLLFCALHEEDAEIGVENMMRYNVGCSLLQGINTMNEARDRVYSLVDKLKYHCLLLDGKSKGYVKMHDVIRDVCISIAKEDEHRMNNITSATVYEQFVGDEISKKSRAISFLGYDDSDKIFQKWEFPSLELLLLSSRSLESIPNEFFEQTRELKSLAIMDTSLKSLFPSFHYLQNIQTLCLRGSSLENIAVIGELKSLKVLDLSLSRFIKLLPKEIGQLRRLQLLDLQGCEKLRVIEPNVISNLTEMEELYLPKEFQGWETDEGCVKERSNASVIEINSLRRLIVFYLSVQSTNILPKWMFKRKLERYQVHIGNQYKISFDFDIEFQRWLHLSLSNMNEINAFGLKSMIKGCQYLSLERLMDVINVAPCLDEDGLPRLKHLRLNQLISLESICHGILPTGSFNELRKVEVSHCGRLKNLFPLSVAKLLYEITVKECEMMEEIVSSNGKEKESDDEEKTQSGKILFPKLESLHLESLSALQKFYAVDSCMEFPVLSDLTIKHCPKLKIFVSSSTVVHPQGNQLVSPQSFFVEKMEMILFPKLNFLKLEGLSDLKSFCATNSCMEFSLLSMLIIIDCPTLKTFVSSPTADHQEENHLLSAKVSFPNLEALLVERCEDLKYLFSFSLAQQKFVKLKSIVVKDCKAMKDIGEEEIQMKMILFPKLEFLGLIGLSDLQRFCATDSCMEFPLLSMLRIQDCPKMKTFVSCPIVDHQEVSQLMSTQNFFNEKMEMILFPKLESLGLLGLSDLQSFCATDSCMEFPSLSMLDIRDCPKLKTFVSSPIADDQEENQLLSAKVSFPNLEGLLVKRCENLKYLFSFSLAQQKFVKLKKILVEDCKAMKDIGVKVGEEEIQMKMILFPKLEYLWFIGLSYLKRFCATDSCMEFPLLSKLYIKDCPKMKTFVSCPIVDHQEVSQLMSTQTFFNEKMEMILFPKLESIGLYGLSDLQSFSATDSCMEFPSLSMLTIKDCPKLKTFVSSPIAHHHEENQLLSAKVSFPNLEELYVKSCENLKYLFSFSLAQHKFVKLKKILVKDCKAMKDIGVKVGKEEIQMKMILFPKLESLELLGLSDLQRFCIIDFCMEFPILSKLNIQDCPKLNTFVSSPTADHQKVNQLASTQSFFNEKVSFPNLEGLLVESCEDLKYLFSFSLAQQKFVKLKSIVVKDCKAVKDIGVKVGEEEIQMKMILFPKLESLVLSRLSALQRFCATDSCMEFPLLSKLYIKDCPKMKTFVSCPIVDHQEVSQLMSTQTFFNEKMEMILFPKLESLGLYGLSDLQSFCATDSCMEFPSLSMLDIRDCPKLKTFVSSLIADHQEQNQFLSSKVSFPNLEELNIGNCENLKYLFSFSLAQQKFVKLKKILVIDCKAMKDIGVKVGEEGIQLEMILLPKLESLELSRLSDLQRFCATDSCMEFPLLSKLYIRDCPKMKTFVSCPIVDHQEVSQLMSTQTFFNEKMKMILFPKLESLGLLGLLDLQSFCATDSCMEFPSLSILEIRDCPKLKTFVSSPIADHQEQNQLLSAKTTFPNLKELTIWGCNNLKYLLSFANVRSLVQLETLKVWMCKNIEKVIVGDMESCGSNAIIFEKLQTLQLLSLPNLVKFCEGDCIECPLLSELWIANTPKMKEFISISTGKRACIVSEEMGMVEVPEQTFFIDKVTSHNLKELTTNWSEVVEEIFETKSSQSSLIFSNLSKLDVWYEPKDKAIAISDVKSFLHKYHNIHTLQLGGSFVDRHQEQQPGHGDGLSDGDGETCELTALIFDGCSILQSIESLSMSFYKLEFLKISDCNRLTCLFTTSTAAILLQLKEMKIKNCSGMREVINTKYYDDNETEQCPLVFHRLHTLELENLPNLKSFYSSNRVMSFPKLNQLCVERCREMMTFSNGIIITDPKFDTIDGISNWEGDVNTTVRKHWENTSYLRLGMKSNRKYKKVKRRQRKNRPSVFGSNSQVSKSRPVFTFGASSASSTTTNSSPTSTSAATNGASSAMFASSNAASSSSSSDPASTTQPVFGASSGQNHQMSMEDSMAEDTPSAPSPLAFGSAPAP